MKEVRGYASLLPAVPVSREETAEGGDDGAGPVGIEAPALVVIKGGVAQSA